MTQYLLRSQQKSGLKRVKNPVGKFFKRQVVLGVLSGKETRKKAKRPYHVGGSSTVFRWMRQFAGLKLNSADSYQIPILRDMKDDSKNLELEKDQYNLDLEKKCGVKPIKNSKKSDKK